jgi:clan AA aspartic protease (TIGR02281 family)
MRGRGTHGASMRGCAGWGALAAGLALAVAVLLGIAAPGAAQGTASVGAVIGLVASQNNVVLEGADVVLDGVGSAYSDSQGRFMFTSVPPGNYRLAVQKQGFPPYVRAVGVRPGITERVEVVLRGLADPPSPAGGRVSVPLVRMGNTYQVRAVLNGRREATFIVDTGASYTTISTAVARELGVRLGPGSPTVTIVTASDTIQVPVGTLESIQIGGLEARDVPVAVIDLPRVGLVVGLLGNTFLSRFQVQLDPVQGTLMLGY